MLDSVSLKLITPFVASSTAPPAPPHYCKYSVDNIPVAGLWAEVTARDVLHVPSDAMVFRIGNDELDKRDAMGQANFVTSLFQIAAWRIALDELSRL